MKENKITFRIEQPIELQVSDETYQTQIVQADGQMIVLDSPVNRKQETLPEQSYQQITAYFHHADEIYSFETDLNFDQDQFTIENPKPSDIHKAQRRHYFRVPASLEVTIHSEEGEAEYDIAEYDWRKYPAEFISRDISGGGLSFISPFDFKLDQIIRGDVRLLTKPSDQTIRFTSRIVNCLPNDKDYVVSAEFINMHEPDRQEIIQYCIQRQLELRKR